MRPDNPRIVYLDANALIGMFNGDSGHEPVAEVIRQAESGKLRIAISTISYVEVRGQGLAGKFDAEKDQRVIDLLDMPYMFKIDFFRGLAIMARRFAQQHALKNYDAVHLASAVAAEADVMMTADKGFRRLFGQKVENVWIDQPYELGDPTLFTV